MVLVGTPEARRRLRDALATAAIEIAGEAATLDEARAAGLLSDAGHAVITANNSSRQRAVNVEGSPVVEPLTPREQQVLELLAEGRSNKSIAARLGISDQTVKFHVASICGKLQAANRTEAVRIALRRGLITV